ncbi:hypothetical protein CDAR_569391 [Caerostris darwini]|uniref:Uncharacterized protein n=1 Tax=Caerostris darwini TaxID=1538125 RepID=A0AAV4UDN7_9ARAC|nr:hypothetical protein CDAR_569391 [Caerostris darwini]
MVAEVARIEDDGSRRRRWQQRKPHKAVVDVGSRDPGRIFACEVVQWSQIFFVGNTCYLSDVDNEIEQNDGNSNVGSVSA